MKIHHRTLFVLSSLVLARSDRAISDEGENQSGSDAGFGIAELSAGGMLAMIVLGIFGACLFTVICCASWSMIMTCLKLHTINIEDPQHNVIHQGSS